MFRAAAPADLPAIVALYADDVLGAARELPTLPLDPRYAAAFAQIDGDDDQLLAVAEEAGDIVGTLQLTFIRGLAFRGGLRGQIEAVRTTSARRGQGIGAAFIGWAVERCRERGCHLVQLTSANSRIDAHRFYDRLGFTASHTGFKLQLDSRQ